MTEDRRIPEIIVKGIKKSIEISKKSESEKDIPSPFVGAVLIKDDKIVETAYRGELEEGDHAEYTLIKKKCQNFDIKDCILITTLEPCTRRSSRKTSCAERIVDAGIKEVWIGIIDPNPEISGKGVTYLRMNNVKVEHFPNDLANKVMKINDEFWEHETSKYKHDLMLNSRQSIISLGSVSTLGRFEEYIEKNVEIDEFVWCLGEKLPLIVDYSLFNFSLEDEEKPTVNYSYPYNIIYGDSWIKPKFNLEKFLFNFDELDENIILVKGPSGIGKSLFLKFLKYHFSNKFKEHNYSKIPILIDLNHFDTNKKILALSLEQLQSVISISNEDFKISLKDNLFLIIADAFNELNIGMHSSVIKELIYLIELYPNIKIILSMTPNTKFNIPLKRGKVTTLWMNPINLDNLKSYYDTQHLSIGFNEFLDQLKQKKLIKLTEIFIFFNYIITYLKKEGKLPVSIYEIIDELINNYFNDFLKKKLNLFELEQSKALWQDILKSLSFYMHSGLKKTRISSSSLKSLFQRELDYFQQNQKISREIKVDDLLDFFISFNILKVEEDNYRFFHDLLFEYHCGLKLVEEINAHSKIFKKRRFFYDKMLNGPLSIAFPLIKNDNFFKKCRKSNVFTYYNGIVQRDELSSQEIDSVKKFIEKKINSQYRYIQKLVKPIIINFVYYLDNKEEFLKKIIENEKIRDYYTDLILELGKLRSPQARDFLLKLTGNAEIYRYRVLALSNFSDGTIQESILNDLKQTWHGSDYLRWFVLAFLNLMENGFLTEISYKTILNLFLSPPKVLQFQFKDETHYKDESSIRFSYRRNLSKILVKKNDPTIIPELMKKIDYEEFDYYVINKVISKICRKADFYGFLDAISNDASSVEKKKALVEIISEASYDIDLDYILRIVENIPAEISDNKEVIFYMKIIEILLQKERITNYDDDKIFTVLFKKINYVGKIQEAIIKVIGKIKPNYLFEENPINTIDYYAFEALLDVIKENKYYELKAMLKQHAERCIPNWNKGARKAFHNYFLFFKILELLLEIDAYEDVKSLFKTLLDEINSWENVNNVPFQIINKFENNDKMEFINKIYNCYIQLPPEKHHYAPSHFIDEIQPFDSEEFISFNMGILKNTAKTDYMLAESAIRNLKALNIEKESGEIFKIYKDGIHKGLISSMLELIYISLKSKGLKIIRSYLNDDDWVTRNRAFYLLQDWHEKKNQLWYNGQEHL